MKRLCTSLLFGLACTLSLTAAAAASDIPQPGNLQLVGEARLNVMFWSVYDSRLYTADGCY